MSNPDQPPGTPSKIDRAWALHHHRAVDIAPLKEQVKRLIQQSPLSIAIPELEDYWNVTGRATVDETFIVVLLSSHGVALVADRNRTDELRSLLNSLRIEVPKLASKYGLGAEQEGRGPIKTILNGNAIQTGFGWRFGPVPL